MDSRATRQPAAPLAIPEIVTCPAEIDIGNANAVGKELRAAMRPGVSVIIADMTHTTFCDLSGARQLMIARDAAAACEGELRLVIPSVAILRILGVLGLDQVLQIYPSLGSALRAGPAAQSQRPPPPTTPDLPGYPRA